MVDTTINWLRGEYESIFKDGSGAMKVIIGKKHKYLFMSLNFLHKGQCHVTMYDYLDGTIKAFDLAMKEHSNGYLTVGKQCSKTTGASDNLFVVNEDCEKVSEVPVASAFHTVVAKTLYVTKRARLDTNLAIAFLMTRVRASNTDDWEKMYHLMGDLRGDQDCPLVLSGENDGVLIWYVDATFVIRPKICGHTGGGLTIGHGISISVSSKQNLNNKRLTESKLVGVNDMMPIILWTLYFLLEQGYGVIENLLLQDNKSSILLERNGKASSGKRTRHINICFFHFRESEYEGGHH